MKLIRKDELHICFWKDFREPLSKADCVEVQLLEVLKEAIVDRAEEMHRILTETKTSELKTFTTDDFRKPISK